METTFSVNIYWDISMMSSSVNWSTDTSRCLKTELDIFNDSSKSLKEINTFGGGEGGGSKDNVFFF